MSSAASVCSTKEEVPPALFQWIDCRGASKTGDETAIRIPPGDAVEAAERTEIGDPAVDPRRSVFSVLLPFRSASPAIKFLALIKNGVAPAVPPNEGRTV